MTRTEMKLVKSSFQQILPIADATAKLFYIKLFELDPDIEQLFKGDKTVQNNKFVCLIETVVHFIGDLDFLAPTLKALGARHADYHVKDEHYDTAQKALMWTLEQVLDQDFTPKIQNAWEEFYILVSSIMKSGMEKAA